VNPANGQPPAGRKPGHQTWRESNNARAGNVRNDDVEPLLHCLDRGGGHFDLAESVQGRVAGGGLERLGLQIDTHRTTGTEFRGGESQHTTATADVEHRVAGLRSGDELLDQKPSGRVMAASEAARTELDEGFEIPPVVFRPRETDTQPIAERHRPRVLVPPSQRGTALGSTHRHLAVSSESNRNLLTALNTSRLHQQNQPASPGRNRVDDF